MAAGRKSRRGNRGAKAAGGGDPPYRHVLITRYNIVSSFGVAGGFDPLDPAWLGHRETLFLRFCAPSVARQTVHDFEWVMFVHPDTPERFLAPLAGHARLIKADNLDDAVEKLDRSIPADDRLFVSSRLDNDDAFAPDYIATARKAALRFRQGPRSSASLTHGVRVELDSMQARGIHYIHCPFVTMVETTRPFRSVCWYPHTKIDNAGPLTAVSTARPMWLQTLHGHNVSNHLGWDAHALGAVDAGLFADRFPGLGTARLAASNPRLRLAVMRAAGDAKAGGTGAGGRKKRTGGSRPGKRRRPPARPRVV